MSDENLIQEINERWPHLNFTEARIQRPDSDFVYQFYTTFLMDFEEKILYATGFNVDVKIDLSPEELVFFKMQKFNVIFKRADIKFLLGDLYQPTYIRTKSFFCMCNHFMTYFENIFPEFEKINVDVMKMCEDNETISNKKIEIHNDINKLQNEERKLLEANDKLQQNIKATENTYAEYCAKGAEKERNIKEKKKEIESLKVLVDKTSSHINVLTAQEKQYLEEMTTEEEYLNLQKLEEQLKSENESLKTDVKDIEDVLAYNSKMLDHFRSCKESIPNTFNADLVNENISMDIQFKELKTQKEKLEFDLHFLKGNYSNEEKKVLDNEKCYLTARIEIAKLIKDIQQEFEELSFTLQKQKGKICSSKRETLSEITQLKFEINQYENDIGKLKEHFEKEYTKITKANSKVFKN